MRFLLRILIVLLPLASHGEAARFRGNLVSFVIITGDGGRPSTRRVFADADTFAVGHGLVRQREQEPDRLYALLPHLPDFAEHVYTLRFDPNQKTPGDDLTLQITRQDHRQRVEFFLVGVRGTRSREFMQRFKNDYAREFSRRYGRRNITEGKQFYDGWQPAVSPAVR